MKKINKKLSLKKEVIAQLDNAKMNHIGGAGTPTILQTVPNCGSGPCNSDFAPCYPTYRCTNSIKNC